jgi:N-acylneuraminate cytidylyltransferase
MNIALIPARCGSKSIPFKNIKNFCGKPLIYWSLLAAQKSNQIDEIYVATDCEEIKSINNIIQLNQTGGNGAVREFINLILKEYS